MYVFLLAGCEVVLSAVVLCVCNLLFIKKTPQQPDHSAKMEMAATDTEMEQLNKISQEDQGNRGVRKESEPKAGEQSINPEVEVEKETPEDPDKPEARTQDELQVDSVDLEKLSQVATKANGGVVEPESSL